MVHEMRKVVTLNTIKLKIAGQQNELGDQYLISTIITLI